MDLNRIRNVCLFYLAELGTLDKLDRSAAENQYAHLIPNLPDDAELVREHVVSMLVRLIEMIDKEPERREKIMRWYGFIQGALWCTGWFSVDQLKDHSRPDVDPPTVSAGYFADRPDGSDT